MSTNWRREGNTTIPISPFLVYEIMLAAVVSCAEKLEKKIADSKRGRKPKNPVHPETSPELAEIRKIVGALRDHMDIDCNIISGSRV